MLDGNSSSGQRPWWALVSGTFLTLAWCVLAGCSPPGPKTADLEKAAGARITEESGGRIAVVNFKTKGQRPNAVGGTFRWPYESDIEFLQDCQWLMDRTGSMPLNFRTAPAGDDQVPSRPMKKGDRQRVQGAVTVERTKDGWKPASVSIAVHMPAP